MCTTFRSSLLFFACTVLCSSLALAVPPTLVPTPPMDPADITGTIVEAKWFPERKHQSVLGGGGRSWIVPAHFYLKLQPFESGPTEIEGRTIDRDTSQWWGKHSRDGSIHLSLDHFDKDYLKKGMKIKVTGYWRRGDERHESTGYTKIEILSAGEDDSDSEPGCDFAIHQRSYQHLVEPKRKVTSSVLVTSSSRKPLKDVAVEFILAKEPVYPSPATQAESSSDDPDGAVSLGKRKLMSFDGPSTVAVRLEGTIPAGTPHGVYYLVAVVDAGNKVSEVDEKNNVAFSKIVVL